MLPALRNHVRSALAGAVWLLAGAACSPYLSRGSTLYEEGRYVEAAEVFERTESRLAESNEEERARYALYRGLTFLKLGDSSGARRWLGHAHRFDHENPGVFSDGQKERLAAGWKLLGTSEIEGPEIEPSSAAVAQHPGGAAPPMQRENGQRSVPEEAIP